MFASTQHNKSLSILQILLIFTSDPDCRIQIVLQIMIPAVRVLSRGFLFLLLLSNWDINPSLVRNSLVNLLMKRQYLSFNKITTLPHISYRRNRFYQQNTRLLNLLWCFSISQMIYLNYMHIGAAFPALWKGMFNCIEYALVVYFLKVLKKTKTLNT